MFGVKNQHNLDSSSKKVVRIYLVSIKNDADVVGIFIL